MLSFHAPLVYFEMEINMKENEDYTNECRIIISIIQHPRIWGGCHRRLLPSLPPLYNFLMKLGLPLQLHSLGVFGQDRVRTIVIHSFIHSGTQIDNQPLIGATSWTGKDTSNFHSYCFHLLNVYHVPAVLLSFMYLLRLFGCPFRKQAIKWRFTDVLSRTLVTMKGRIRQEEDVNHDAVATEWLADTAWNPGTIMAWVQICPRSNQWCWAFVD